MKKSDQSTGNIARSPGGENDESVAVSPPGTVSLEGMHRSVAVPHRKAGFWKQMAVYFGPAVLVSVAYMDPGNWGTDLQGGAQFKYGLLWVVGLASMMAIFLQIIAARVGIATERDLAQCLDSVRCLAGELIVVDTGSTDATPDIAARYGAKVIPFDFAMVDFAAARNHAIASATGALWRNSLGAAGSTR